MFEQILNSLMPIFLVVALGVALRASRFLSAEFFLGLNKLVFWVGLPTLLFYKIATAELSGGMAMRVFCVLLIGTVAVGLLGFVIAVVWKMPRASRGAFLQAAFRGNLAYIGLPVILYAMTGQGDSDALIEASAVLVLAPIVPIYNVASVLVLLFYGAGDHRPSVGQLVMKMLCNPLLIACALGALVSFSGVELPVVMDRTCRAVSQMALPLALIAIGASLTWERLHGAALHSVVAAILKVGVAPLVGYAVARMMEMNPTETRMALFFLACPTAVASYVMAEQLGGDDALAGSAVVLSTLFSAVSLSAVMVLTA